MDQENFKFVRPSEKGWFDFDDARRETRWQRRFYEDGSRMPQTSLASARRESLELPTQYFACNGNQQMLGLQ